jgi:hypothetical protein|tara:strand:- start:1402 stop:1866 length:465 start_codon:yes stop_codon:yes gene_type:complete
MCGHFSAIMAMVGPPTYPAPMQHTVLFERERERKRRDVSVCREKQISETRSRVYKSTCVFDHDDARFVSSGTKRTTPTTKRVVQKIIETTREKTLENNGGRSIDRFYALLVIFTISFALTTTQKGPPTTNAQSTLEYLGYYYVRKEKKRGRRRL